MVMCPVGFRALRTTLERTVVSRFGHRLVDHDGTVATAKVYCSIMALSLATCASMNVPKLCGPKVDESAFHVTQGEPCTTRKQCMCRGLQNLVSHAGIGATEH